MTITFLGFTVLLAGMFPLGNTVFRYILGGLPMEVVKSIPRVYFTLGMLLTSYLLAAIIIAIFFKYSRLKERINKPYPAQKLMLAGLLLIAAQSLLYIVATTVEGGGAAFTVLQFSSFVIWPAKAMLLTSAVMVLLAAKPLTKHSSGTPNGAP